MNSKQQQKISNSLQLKSFKGEEWKSIFGYDGFYEISNYGRIKALKREVLWRDTCRVLSSKIKKKNYSKSYRKGVMKRSTTVRQSGTIRLHGEHKPQIMSVGRLVYTHFIGDVPEDQFVLRRDATTDNDFVTNLYLGTVSDRTRVSYVNHPPSSEYTEKTIKKVMKNRQRPIEQLTKEGALVKEYPSIKEASTITGINKADICSVCMTFSGTRRKKPMYTAGGYKWRYKQETTTNE